MRGVKSTRAELIAEIDGPRTRLGESPRWDGAAWWWVDAAAGDVWTQRPGGAAVLAYHTGRRTSLVLPEVSGRVVIACDETLLVLEDGGDSGWHVAQTWCQLPLAEGWQVNDGVADSAGGVWIGSIAPGRQKLSGALLHVDPDGITTEGARGFTFTNGMAFDAAGTTLYHVDTGERTIWAHRIDIRSGKILGGERFLTLSGDDGLPDGIDADADGGIWVAVYGTGEVRRFDSAGRLSWIVTVDPPQCTSVALGGPDRHDLLITTAREGYDDERSLVEPLAGRLYRARASVPGTTKPKVVAYSGRAQ